MIKQELKENIESAKSQLKSHVLNKLNEINNIDWESILNTFDYEELNEIMIYENMDDFETYEVQELLNTKVGYIDYEYSDLFNWDAAINKCMDDNYKWLELASGIVLAVELH